MLVSDMDRACFAEQALYAGTMVTGLYVAFGASATTAGLMLTLVGLALLVYRARSGSVHNRTVRKWLALTVLLAGCTWAVVAYDIYEHRAASLPSQGVFINWLGGSTHLCSATVDGSELISWSRYHLVLICGLADPETEALEDTRITVSRSFPIRSGPLVITVPYSNEMNTAIDEGLQWALRSAPKSGVVSLQWTKWYRIVLLPEQCVPSDIHRLSDVPRCGGTILSQIAEIGAVSSGNGG